MCLNSGTNFKLLDQILDPQPALSRNEVLQQKDVSKKEPRDSRNLYLAKEGTILAGTPAAEGVSQSDLAKRLRLEQSKSQSLKNLNRFVSMERLTVHNIPPSYDSVKLREVVTKACGLKVCQHESLHKNKLIQNYQQQNYFSRMSVESCVKISQRLVIHWENQKDTDFYHSEHMMKH